MKLNTPNNKQNKKKHKNCLTPMQSKKFFQLNKYKTIFHAKNVSIELQTQSIITIYSKDDIQLSNEAKISLLIEINHLSIQIIKLRSSRSYINILEFPENQYYILIVQNFYGKSLKELLQKNVKNNKKQTEKQCIQILKDVTRSLIELQRQNYYLSELSLANIFQSNKKYVIRPLDHPRFSNQRQQKGQNQSQQIVSNHIFSLGKILYMLLIGENAIQNLTQSQLTESVFQAIKGKLAKLPKFKAFNEKISSQVKLLDFILLIFTNHSTITWEEFIANPIFGDELKTLIKSNSENLLSVPQPPSQLDKKTFTSLNIVQTIFTNVIKATYDKDLFDLKDKKIIQILYLIAIRCLNDLNIIISHQKDIKKHFSCFLNTKNFT